MKGDRLIVNGDTWVIVDVAPAAPLAEMVAALLEEEGFTAMVRGANLTGDVFSHMGTPSAGATYVLVPEADAERAMQLVADTVTDYEGDELESIMRAIEEGTDPDELFGASAEDDRDEEEGEPHGDGGPGHGGADGAPADDEEKRGR